jgi:hypothetical protein
MSATRSAANIITVTGQEAATTERVYVTNLHWIGATTAGHLLQVTNAAGAVIRNHKVSAANEYIFIPVYEWCLGVTVADMDSGTLDIHLG